MGSRPTLHSAIGPSDPCTCVSDSQGMMDDRSAVWKVVSVKLPRIRVRVFQCVIVNIFCLVVVVIARVIVHGKTESKTKNTDVERRAKHKKRVQRNTSAQNVKHIIKPNKEKHPKRMRPLRVPALVPLGPRSWEYRRAGGPIVTPARRGGGKLSLCGSPAAERPSGLLEGAPQLGCAGTYVFGPGPVLLFVFVLFVRLFLVFRVLFVLILLCA